VCCLVYYCVSGAVELPLEGAGEVWWRSELDQWTRVYPGCLWVERGECVWPQLRGQEVSVWPPWSEWCAQREGVSFFRVGERVYMFRDTVSDVCALMDQRTAWEWPVTHQWSLDEWWWLWGVVCVCVCVCSGCVK